MAKIDRLEKQRDLLERRGHEMLLLSLNTLKELEERDLREREERLHVPAGGSPNPESSGGPSAPKRPRHGSVGSAAPQSAEPAESAGEPVAGARSPHSPELADSARLFPYALNSAVLENFPLFLFGDDSVSVGDGSL